MLKSLKKLKFLLSISEKKQAIALVILLILTALMDAVGVASIMPFMAVLVNPEVIHTNEILSAVYSWTGATNTQSFLFFLGVISISILVTSLALKAITTYKQHKFSFMREYSIGRRLIELYLHQPYSWFSNKNSAKISQKILSEVGQVITKVLIPVTSIVAQILVVIAMLALLVIVDPVLAISVIIALSIVYGIIFFSIRIFITKAGFEKVISDEARFVVVNEAFNAIKMIKIRSLEGVFLDQFKKPAKIYAKSLASSEIVGLLPRFILELVAFGGMIVVTLYLMMTHNDPSSMFPIIALYAFAGYRILPALQQIYYYSSQIQFSTKSLDNIYNEFVHLHQFNNVNTCKKNFKFNKKISLSRIYYSHLSANSNTLSNINITIPVGSSIAFIGATGSGKTTIVDLISGLLTPDKGAVAIDTIELNRANYSQWQKIVGYVPQDIYLIDDTIAANVAFGIEKSLIDYKAVKTASRIAQLHEFVENKLLNGYETEVGERGAKLSGGQIQRIGIARALYHNPKVLFLDEATSALDNITESKVMKSIRSSKPEITIIMIAHRISTIKDCDNIFLLDEGCIVESGTFDELLEKNKKFKLMVGS
jgi:ATP-binding cassette, subfamily B, bacterial PglK